MLYILSGTSRSGKTITAKEFLRRNGISYIPVDVMMMGFTNGFPSFGIHHELWPDEIAEKMWPFLLAMCDNLIWGEEDFLLEGEGFLPQLVKKLVDDNPGKVKVAFMGYASANIEEKVREVKHYSKGAGDWLANESDQRIKEHIKNMVGYSKMIKLECEKHGLPYFDTSTEFENSIASIITSFEES